MTNNETENKFPLIATILTVVGCVFLIFMGAWQLDRLAWKTNLIDQMTLKPGSVQRVFGTLDLSAENEFEAGVLTGQFVYPREVLIEAKVFNGEPGYHVITPFVVNDGGIVFVNRGWVPLSYKPGEAPLWDLNPGQVRNIFGMVTEVSNPNVFVPNNIPERDQWYWIDLDEIAKAKAIENFVPVLFVQRERNCESKDVQSLIPTPCGSEVRLSNNHLQYAIFWFVMAGVLVVFYYLRFLK